MSALSFESVSVRYGVGRRALTAVDDVSLVVPQGQVVGLVGESGSGKSTLARAAVGLSPLHSGRILVNGQPLRTLRRQTPPPVQMVFQDPYSSLDPRMSVGSSIAEALPRAVRRDRRAADAEVARLLNLVQLDPDRARSLPSGMSGGQRQRIALARALAANPTVVIADEITSALDVSVQGAVLNLLRNLQAELRLSVLFISHNLAVVRYVSDILAVMYLGRIVEAGPTEELLADPRHPYTQELLAAIPREGTAMLAGAGADPSVEAVADVEPANPHDPPAGCRYHPRCPIGPLVLPGREVCIDIDPHASAGSRTNEVACHFAGGRTLLDLAK